MEGATEMTELRKICPKSGESCDCPKGVCNKYTTDWKLFHEISHKHDAEQIAAYQQIAKQVCDDEGLRQKAEAALFECPTRQSKGFEQSQLPNRCTFCDGTFSGNPPTRKEVYDAQTSEEQSRIDRQEAGSLKYALCAQILLLSSGKFALFGAYSMDEGIPLIAIDTWENLEPLVRAYRKTAEDGYAEEKQEEEQRCKGSSAKTAADYDSLFGPEEN